MLASQLIYTGCGKDKTGAFSVWSKTLDITKNEENEIRDRMLYKRPSNLPFEPTEEELETLFPKKIGYFRLSSGRSCLAQSVYIGNVYSDLDKRTGNYIIHAFVFDKQDDIIPMNFIESDIFKRGLTYQEWHDQDAPAELPKVEIVDKPSTLTKQEIDAFFNDENTMRLKLLLQAIINASTTDQKITFYDNHKNLKYWYKAISLCTPKSLQSELTFNTFYTPTTQMPTQNQAGGAVANTEIKIRNISPTVASTIFNYQQDVRAGKYSFDFESNIIQTAIDVSPFVENVVELLKVNIFNAIMFVDTIGKISAKCNVDLNTAIEIQYMLNKQIAKVDQIDKLNLLLKYVIDYYPESITAIADSLYEYGFKSGKWAISGAISNIYRFVFENSAIADKNDMIYGFIKNQGAFGVNIHGSETEYCTSFKSVIHFSFESFITFIFGNEGLKKYFEASGSSFNSKYLIFNTFVDTMPEISKSQDRKTIALKYLRDTARSYIQAEQLNEFLLLIKCIEKCGSKWQSWLIKSAYEAMCKDGKRLSDVCNISFTLDLAEACSNIDVSADLVLRLIGENEKNTDFIKIYVAHYDRNKSFYTNIFREPDTQKKYEDFFRNVEFYHFAIATTVSKSQLTKYYNEYFSVGKDSRGLFVKKLKQYLLSYGEKERVKECIDCYDLWVKDKRLDASSAKACAVAICEAFFSVSTEMLKKYIVAKGTQKIDEIIALAADGYSIPDSYYVISFGEELKKDLVNINPKKSTEREEQILKALDEERFYRIPKNSASREMLIKMYMPDIVHLYLLLVAEDNFEQVYISLFKPLHTAPCFEDCFYEAIRKLSDKDFNLFLGDTFICACNGKGKFAEFMLEFGEEILENMSRGEKKKFFVYLLEHVPEKYEEKVSDFVEKYQKDHEGFLEKILNLFAKKQSDDAPTDNKKRKK